MTTVSMIDVARHLAEYVNLVVDRGERFTLMREGKPVAELGPVLTTVRLEDLPAFLASLPCLTPATVDEVEGDGEAADPLLDEVEAAQRKLDAEFDNDPAKLRAHYEEAQKRYADRLISRHAAGWVAETGKPAA
jgi:antitoxin (DNA-binding transcriptional repressor) of toxin-antitoxin stability system